MPTVAILGATGRMGGATARASLAQGIAVRAITRNPASDAAGALAGAGAEVVRAEMESVDDLARAFDGVDGVFNVQSAFDERGRHHADREAAQGRNVAAALRRASVPHVVYGSAGTDAPTGVPHFDVKLEIEAALREACPLVTVLRPAPFMELLVDPSFVPALSTWGAEPKVVGWDTPIPWVATEDIGVVAAEALARPDELGGQIIYPVADIQTLRQARDLIRSVTGRAPRGIPIPVWLFKRMVGDDLVRMWAFIRDHGSELMLDPEDFRTLHPSALTLEAWLRDRHAADEDAAERAASSPARRTA